MKKAIVAFLCLAMLIMVFSCESGGGGGGSRKPPTITYEGTSQQTKQEYVLEITGNEYSLLLDGEEISYGTVTPVTTGSKKTLVGYTCYPEWDEELTFVVKIISASGVITEINGDIHLEEGGKINSPGALNAITKVTLDPTTLPIFENATDTITSDVPVTWSITAGVSKATISSSTTTTATILGVEKGTATVTATSIATPTIKATCAVTVYKENEVLVKLTPSSLELEVGETETITAVATNGANGVTWSSSDPTIATVTTGGKVEGIKRGTATITATSKDEPDKKDTCTVTVKNASTGGDEEEQDWIWYVMTDTAPNPDKIRGQSIFGPLGDVSHIDCEPAEFPDEEGVYGWVPNIQTDAAKLKDNSGNAITDTVFNFKGNTKVSAPNRGQTVNAQFPMAGWGAIAASDDMKDKIKTATGYKFWIRYNSATGSGYSICTAVETDQFDAGNGFDFRHWIGYPSTNSGGSYNTSQSFTTGAAIGQWKQIIVYFKGANMNMDQDKWLYNFPPNPDEGTTKGTVWKPSKPPQTLQQSTAKQLQWQIPLQHQATASPAVTDRGSGAYDIITGSFDFDVDFYGLELFE